MFFIEVVLFFLGVYVENLTEYVVHSPKEVLNLLKVGRRRLVFAETQMNRASSRSEKLNLAICFEVTCSDRFQKNVLKQKLAVCS